MIPLIWMSLALSASMVRLVWLMVPRAARATTITGSWSYHGIPPVLQGFLDGQIYAKRQMGG